MSAGFSNLGMGMLGSESKYYEGSGGDGVSPLSYGLGYLITKMAGENPDVANYGNKMMGVPPVNYGDGTQSETQSLLNRYGVKPPAQTTSAPMMPTSPMEQQPPAQAKWSSYVYGGQ